MDKRIEELLIRTKELKGLDLALTLDEEIKFDKIDFNTVRENLNRKLSGLHFEIQRINPDTGRVVVTNGGGRELPVIPLDILGYSLTLIPRKDGPPKEVYLPEGEFYQVN